MADIICSFDIARRGSTVGEFFSLFLSFLPPNKFFRPFKFRYFDRFLTTKLLVDTIR